LKVLFIPNAGAVVPHLAPLMALDMQLDPGRHETAFLLPARFHASLAALGKRVLPIDYRFDTAFRDEVAACTAFAPDVIIDDFSLVALLTASAMGIPRVTIARTGAFPGYAPRDDAHLHSSESIGRFDFENAYRDCEEVFGIPPPRSFADACLANASIVPGIRSIECLPAEAADRADFVFAGALSLPDEAMPRADDAPVHDADATSAFLDRQQGRPCAFVTLGSVLAPSLSIRSAILHLLEHGMAVVSTVRLDGLPETLAEHFHFAPFVRMHAVCARADLMVHHCGSGTYQYAILHRLPSICIGSRYYDRDDVAHRLEELGVAKYVPASDDPAPFMSAFRAAFDAYASDGEWLAEATRRLEALVRENDETAAGFDLGALLHAVVQEAYV